MLVLVHATAVLLLEPPRRFWARLLPLLALLPVVAYLYWLFYRNPAFAFYSGTTYVFPPFTDFLWALGPAVLLATGAAFAGSAGEACRRARVYLSLWAAFALLVIVVRPVGFSLQFLVGLGVPLLALGAVALGRFKPNILWLATFAFSLTFGVALNFMLTPRSFWLTRRDTMAVVETLRLTCRKGDILFAPPEVGLFAHGLTACRALVSHPISPDYDERRARSGALRQSAAGGSPCPARRAARATPGPARRPGTHRHRLARSRIWLEASRGVRQPDPPEPLHATVGAPHPLSRVDRSSGAAVTTERPTGERERTNRVGPPRAAPDLTGCRGRT